ncbi:hypothetical protein MMPV_008905 [Pyropia vietnamensis]
MTLPPPGWGTRTLPAPPLPSLLFPALRQDDVPLPTPEAADPSDGPSRQTLLLSGGAFAFIPLSFLVIFYMFMRREFKRSAIRRAQRGGILRSTSRGDVGVGDGDYGGYGSGGGGYGTDNRGRAIPSPTGSGHSDGGGGGGGSKRHRYGDTAAVAAALNVVPLPDGASTACAICLDESHPDRTEAALACGHTYHGACIRQWLAKSDTCPLCAAPVREALFAAAEERRHGKGGVAEAGPRAGIGTDVTVAMDDEDTLEEAAWREATGAAAARTAARLSGDGNVAVPTVADTVEREAPMAEAAAAAPLGSPAMTPDTVVVIRPSGFDHPPVVPPPPVAVASPST